MSNNLRKGVEIVNNSLHSITNIDEEPREGDRVLEEIGEGDDDERDKSGDEDGVRRYRESFPQSMSYRGHSASIKERPQTIVRGSRNLNLSILEAANTSFQVIHDASQVVQ